jgi:hypothetical protein
MCRDEDYLKSRTFLALKTHADNFKKLGDGNIRLEHQLHNCFLASLFMPIVELEIGLESILSSFCRED